MPVRIAHLPLSRNQDIYIVKLVLPLAAIWQFKFPGCWKLYLRLFYIRFHFILFTYFWLSVETDCEVFNSTLTADKHKYYYNNILDAFAFYIWKIWKIITFFQSERISEQSIVPAFVRILSAKNARTILY